MLEKGCVRSLARRQLALNFDPFLLVRLFVLETLHLRQLGGGCRWLLRRTSTNITALLEVIKSSLGGEACLRDDLMILYFFVAWQSRSIVKTCIMVGEKR